MTKIAVAIICSKPRYVLVSAEEVIPAKECLFIKSFMEEGGELGQVQRLELGMFVILGKEPIFNSREYHLYHRYREIK